ncbi:MAG: ribosome small subunit-dependent GTPase A [Bacteroidales bacterium]|nr:ribosome small subunit-dependent GTPase A [Bacteroidales bacterium]MDD5974423.1 ribosome small subunit-dependent GTPase A [Bacteroidales bacterium]MDY5193631.1 ribosome small subunit-dependent GTPase A [Candidatus Aphodosoma sp.]
MTGFVIKTTGPDYTVRSTEGDFVCKIKGNFRIKGIKATNPITVGDIVDFDPAQGYITELHDRRNYIVRKPTNLSKQLHIIAANIDLSLLVITIKNPETSTTFIDRFLTTAEAYHVPVTLIFNKTDLLTEEESEYLEALEYLYRNIGYNTIRTSAISGDGIEEIRKLLPGKFTLLSGNSGVGKSTILNKIIPEANARTANISESHHKGMHTTTFSEMYEVDSNSYLIDTPGIKGFGMFDMEKDEISHFFPEIFKIGQECKFNNCTHTHEPGCAVLKALDEHLISQSRYRSYLSIREDATESKYR